MNYLSLQTPLGPMTVCEEGGKIIRLYLQPSQLPCQIKESHTPVLKKAAQQLAEYFAGTRKTFDLPLAPQGTPFQQKVWRALCLIPYGKTVSYAEIAARIGHIKACRAVGMANHKNPIPILIPCHRVIGSDGSMTGYASGLDIKRALLSLEKQFS